MTVISIPLDTYLELIEADQKLSALEAHGVDSWEWYNVAMESLEEGIDEAIQDEIFGHLERP